MAKAANDETQRVTDETHPSSRAQPASNSSLLGDASLETESADSARTSKTLPPHLRPFRTALATGDIETAEKIYDEIGPKLKQISICLSSMRAISMFSRPWPMTKNPLDTNNFAALFYMGVNVATAPVRGVHQMLAAALEITDGLVGTKVSLVGHYLVLSASLGAAGVSVEDLDYHYKLITAQQTWFREQLSADLG